MKRIKIKVKGLLAGVACMSCVICVACSGGADIALTPPEEPSVSASDKNWDVLDGGLTSLENDNILLELDAETTHFTVTDKRTGVSYRSVPEGVEGFGEDASRICSEVTVRYYSQQTDAQHMYSGTDSVDKEHFQVKTDGEAVRVYYSMGTADMFVPPVLSQEEFETKVLDKLDEASLQRRLVRYYILYSSEDPPSDYSDMLSRYPQLKTTPLYILSDTVSDMENEEISGYMADAGYTPEQYAAETKKHDFQAIEMEKSAGFTIAVEYRLSEDGFTAEVLADLIKENSQEYKLQSIDFLEYFASFGENENGIYVVPDGSGSLMDMNVLAKKQTPGQMTKPFYGADYAVQTDSMTQLAKNLTLPVYGMQNEQGGILTIVERASEVATLNVQPLNSAGPHNRLYTSFEMRSIDVTSVEINPAFPIYNLFAKDCTEASPKIRCIFLDDQHNSYADMAARYREYLRDKGQLSALKQAPAAGMYLDYLCMTTESSTILGIPYTKKTVLSTLKDIQASVEKLHEAGVRGLYVRLLGYGNGGLENSVYNTFTLDSKVGSRKQLLKLADTLLANGGKLYLDADFSFAYNKKNGFRMSEDASHYLTRKLVHTTRYDIVTRQYHDGISRFAVSPIRYVAFAQGYLDSLKSLKAETLPGVSYGATGLYLGGDHTPKRGVDRTQSAAYLGKALEASFETAGELMFDNGNGYVLPYAGHLLGVPLSSSGADTESASIPFYQMVVHGSVSYAGTPVNIAANSEKARLSSVALGAVPYAAFMTEPDNAIKGTAYESVLYSLSDRNRLDPLIEQWKSSNTCREAVADSFMTGYEETSSQLSRTEYSNGVRIYTNFSDEEQTLDGVSVEAHGFALVRAS